MLVGTGDLAVLSQRAPTINAFQRETVELGEVTCLQMIAEMHKSAREPTVPPSLHPTSPATLCIQVWKVGKSPWGPFLLAWCRVSTRSGVRARGYSTQAYVSTEAACEALRGIYGLPAEVADISFRNGYDGCECRVISGDKPVLRLAAIDPEPMGPSDVQYTGSMNLAQTPRGLRLVQMEAHHQPERVDRLSGRLVSFDPAAWGNPLLDPYVVVSTSVAREAVVIPPIRFVCKPDELAFSGTESVEDTEP